MDPLGGKVGQRDQLIAGRQPELELRRSEAEPEERLDVYCRTLT
jgi:hypothetical protein